MPRVSQTEGHRMTVSEREAQIITWLAEQKDAMIDLLRDVVNIDSGSYDKAGVDAVGARFERFFAEHGLLTRREANERFGDAIHIRLDDRLAKKGRSYCWAIAIRCSQRAKLPDGLFGSRMAVRTGRASQT